MNVLYLFSKAFLSVPAFMLPAKRYIQTKTSFLTFFVLGRRLPSTKSTFSKSEKHFQRGIAINFLKNNYLNHNSLPDLRPDNHYLCSFSIIKISVLHSINKSLHSILLPKIITLSSNIFIFYNYTLTVIHGYC